MGFRLRVPFKESFGVLRVEGVGVVISGAASPLIWVIKVLTIVTPPI